MQVVTDQVIDVITMGHGCMPAVWTVDMVRCMTATDVRRRAGRRIQVADGERVVVYVSFVVVVQVAVMQVVGMTFMQNGAMPAVWAVDMIVVVVGVVSHL